MNRARTERLTARRAHTEIILSNRQQQYLLAFTQSNQCDDDIAGMSLHLSVWACLTGIDTQGMHI